MLHIPKRWFPARAECARAKDGDEMADWALAVARGLGRPIPSHRRASAARQIR
jgi:hypothetical protein